MYTHSCLESQCVGDHVEILCLPLFELPGSPCLGSGLVMVFVSLNAALSW